MNNSIAEINPAELRRKCFSKSIHRLRNRNHTLIAKLRYRVAVSIAYHSVANYSNIQSVHLIVSLNKVFRCLHVRLMYMLEHRNYLFGGCIGLY